MSEQHHQSSPPPDHHHHADHGARGSAHYAAHAGERHHQEATPPLRVTTDPYPFIYSKDPLDRRRYTLFGRAPTGRTSRGETIFAVVVIVAVLGIGVLTIAMALFGK